MPVVFCGGICEVLVLAVGDQFAPGRRRLVAVVAGELAAVPPRSVQSLLILPKFF